MCVAKWATCGPNAGPKGSSEAAVPDPDVSDLSPGFIESL